MKRLYLVGTTADSKRLVLAKSSGAKFGSFVVPITPKLKKILRELEEGRAENLRDGGSEEEPPATAAEAAASNTFERMTGLTEAASRGGSAAPGGAKAKSAGRKGRAAPPPEPEPEPEPEPPKPAERRPPINSKLAPAQIQALLRQGKSAKSVAGAAGAPLDWVRRLMEPILLERIGIVEEMKRATYSKARRGPSRVPVGLSIIDNLRDRGVAFPERAAAGGWTAYRPDGREWRVRFTYDHRGAKRTAQWEYDPPTRSVVPLNTLATQLSWRGEELEGEGNGDSSRSRRRATPMRKRAPARKAAPRRAKASAARKSSGKKAPARKATARKKVPARKKAPARKRTAARRRG